MADIFGAPGLPLDVITGTADNDFIDGNDGTDIVFAGDGHDIVLGGDGIDLLVGQGGNDLIYGENGNDLIIGGAGNDTLNGGAGDDTFFSTDGGGVDRVEDFTVGQDQMNYQLNSNVNNFAEFSAAANQVGPHTFVYGGAGPDANHTILENTNEADITPADVTF